MPILPIVVSMALDFLSNQMLNCSRFQIKFTIEVITFPLSIFEKDISLCVIRTLLGRVSVHAYICTCVCVCVHRVLVCERACIHVCVC